MMENRSYHYLPSTWDFRTGGKQSKPDQTHERGHDMDKGKVVPVYARVACSSILSDLVDFNGLSSPRAGCVPTLAGPVMSSNSTFKLDKLVQQRDSMRDEYTSNAFPSLRKSKRARTMNLNCQIPLCQVFGCNLNLSFSKEYHKKHKVCEVHSKTARVIVNGLEQRFCQQCSRFHLLAEFDDGKRSCRKRLAGHNLRRRKPQIAHKDGYNFMDMISSPQTSFLCSNMLSSREGKRGTMSKGNFYVKTEPIYNHHPSPVALSQHGNGKQLSIFQASSVGICSEDSERFSLDHFSCVSAPSSQPQLPKTYSGNESLFATRGITSVSDTACALSLLSTQPHNFFIQSPVLNNHRPAHGNSSSLSETFGSSSHSQFSISVAPNRLFSLDNSNMNANHFGGLSASEARNTTIKDKICGTADSLNYMTEKNGMYSTDQGAANVGMFHLNSQLHGMGSRRNSIQVKMAKDNFMSCIGL